eukprot:2721555-Prymnesium_polylepis.1
MGHLSGKLGREATGLMMARTAEYRTMVLDRQRMEALRRQTHPYGGDRAWQLGLRSGGIFYEPIGSYINGLYCPFRPPHDLPFVKETETTP